MKNCVKTALCVPVFLWIMGASVLFAQEVKAVKLKKPLRPQERQGKIKECVIKSPSKFFALLVPFAVKLKETLF
ncbi:hypothetical protein [Treponema denticola]|uniref:hypothetical protein n=1 Tax=Treponema denticola TaxID=158 RepID=UPI002104B23A|nr:hypothetical protein [Treponema denticola]UTY23629.1 hypothetical protein E4N78_05395 [Treponema denticola]